MKTKLLFVYGPLGGGGAERVLLDLLSNLDAASYEIDLCLMVNQGILLPEVPAHIRIIPLFETYNLHYKLAYRLSNWLNWPILFERILNKKLKSNYDYSISFLEGMPLKLHAYLQASHPKITWVHIDVLNFPYTDKLFVKDEQINAYQKMDKIICVSNDTQKMFQAKFPGFEKQLKVIYNPIDAQKIKSLAGEKDHSNDDVFEIIAVGRLTEQKRMDRLIRVVSRLKDEGKSLQLQIVGEGELRNDLTVLIEELNLEQEVELLGFQKNPFKWMSQADILVLPSAAEGFGLVLVEAMVLGVPVVSTKTAGPEEILGENEFGLLCEQNEESIYKAVKKLMEDETLRKKLSEKGQQRAKDFAVEKMIESFEELLKEKVKRKK